jgi:ferredoxin
MNIFNLAFANLLHGPTTQRFPNREAPAPAFRGHVEIDSDLCVTCGICALVCVSAAIEVVPLEATCSWTYDPAACTFCGSCVEHCPVDALTQAADRGPACALPGAQAVTITVEYPACSECGRPAMAYSEALLQLALPGATDDLRKRARLCGDCRQKSSVLAMKRAFAGPDSTERQDHGR